MSELVKHVLLDKFHHSKPAVWLTKKFYDVRNQGLEKLFFTATTGRSGTLTLTKLFEAVPGAKAYHEPYPVMNGEWLKKASFGAQKEVYDYFHAIKSVYIRRGAAGAKYYLEANHLFLKTFIAPAIEEFGGQMEIIHLVRPVLEVANSIYRIGNWPGTEDGNKWWLDYKAENNILDVAQTLENDPQYAHPFYKALWYWYETQARVAYWKKKAPAIKFHRIETGDFNDIDKITAFMNGLGVSYDMHLLRGLVGKKENDIHKKKGKEGLSLSEQKQMQDSFEELLRSREMAWETAQETGYKFKTKVIYGMF